MTNRHNAPSNSPVNGHKEDEVQALNSANNPGIATRRQVLAGGAVALAGVIASQLPSSAQRLESLPNEVAQTTPTGRLQGKIALITRGG
jgi:hypothetical protein